MKRQHRIGFTLVELLVAIGIIALLIALLQLGRKRPMRPSQLACGTPARQSMRWSGVLAGLLQVLMAAPALAASSDSGDALLSRRFLQECPGSWQQYRAWASRVQGRCVQSTKLLLPKSGPGFREEGRFAENTECKLYVVEEKLFADGKQESEAFGFNPKYSFQLSRRDRASPWVLVDLRMGTVSTGSRVELATASSLFSQCRVISTPHGDLLTDLVRQPSFRLLGAKTVTENGQDLVRIDFDNRHGLTDTYTSTLPSRGPYCYTQGGWMVLDPARFWCLRSADFHGLDRDGWRFDCRVDVELRDRATEYPIPKRVVSISDRYYPSFHERGEWVDEFDLSVPSALPSNADFTLTAFGLPEPPGITWKKPTPWYIWITVAGGGLLIAGISFRWLRRRYFTKPAAP